MTARPLSLLVAASLLAGCSGSDPDPDVDECVDIGGTDEEGALVLLGGSLRGFFPEVAFVHWDCEDQRMEITLSQQACDPEAAEDQLMVRLYRQDVEAGRIESGGSYSLGGETYIDVRFETPEGNVWGTCAGEAGEITFDSVGTAQGSRVAGSFDVPLSPCESAGLELPDGRVEGAFDLRVPVSYDAACPAGGDPHPRDR